MIDESTDFEQLWDYRNPDQTEAKFRELLPSAAAKGVSYHCQLLTQIGRTQGLQRNFEQAHQTLDQAESMLGEDMPKAHTRYLLERGRLFNSSGQKEKAKPLFLAAWEKGESHNLAFEAIDAAHMMGIVEPPEKQLDWSIKALHMAENATEERAQKWRGALYNNIGWSYHDMKKYEAALAYFEKSLAWRQSLNKAREIRIAQWCIGRVRRSLGQLEVALAIQEALQQEYAELPDEDGYVYEELGECLYLLNRKAEAKPHFTRAYELLAKDQWLVANEAKRLARLKTLGAA